MIHFFILLQSSYPKIGLGKRFLCSGGYIGYAPVINSLMNDHELSDTDDDQLYYTKIFLDEEKRVRNPTMINSVHVYHSMCSYSLNTV